MAIRYYFEVEDFEGNVVDIIQVWNSASVINKAEGTGSLSLFMTDFNNPVSNTVQNDYFLRLRRQDTSVSLEWKTVMSFITRTRVSTFFENGNQNIAFYGSTPEDLISATSVMYRKGSAQAKKSGDCAAVLAEYATENMTSVATIANGRAVDRTLPLTVEFQDVGLDWEGDMAWKNLQDVFIEVCEYARLNNVMMAYEVVYNGDGTFTLRVGGVGFVGNDFTDTGLDEQTGLNGAGNVPIVLSPQNQNVRYYNERFVRFSELNVIVAAGQGDGDSQLVAVAQGENATISPFSARERAFSAKSQDNAQELQSFADAKLYEFQAQRDFDAEPDPLAIAVFGDINTKDWITVLSNDGQKENRMIHQFNLSIADQRTSPADKVTSMNFVQLGG